MIPPGGARLRLNDHQYLVRLRALQPLKRVTAYAMVIVGSILAVGIGTWGLLQRIRLMSAFDELASATSPTTRQAVEAVQHWRDVSNFALGTSVGVLFATGVFLATFGLVMVTDRRKDRLLLDRDAAAPRPS
jgi:hypothetical protein